MPACESGIAPALTLGDLPWGMLVGASVGDADRSRARRAPRGRGQRLPVLRRPRAAPRAPDRARGGAVARARRGVPRRPAPVAASLSAGRASAPSPSASRSPSPARCASSSRSRRAATTSSSALPDADAALGLVGVGALGDSLLADVDRQRAAGHDVAAVRVVAWRPFPGAAPGQGAPARARDHGPRGGRPAARRNGPLAVQLKAAFADALTWAPGLPRHRPHPAHRVGRRVGRAASSSASDLDAIVHNMLADERGKRSFVVGGEAAARPSRAPPCPVPQGAPSPCGG